MLCMIVSSLSVNAQTKNEKSSRPPKANITKFSPPQLKESGVEINAFYNRNPSVANIFWGLKDTILIKLKDGKIEEYDFKYESQKENFEDKYGMPPKKPQQKTKKFTPPKIKDSR